MDIRTQRSWMYNKLLPGRRGLTPEFVSGVKYFLSVACQHDVFITEGKIRCPCFKHQNKKFLTPDEVQLDLYRKGFQPNYWYWTSHGECEPRVFSSVDINDGSSTSQTEIHTEQTSRYEDMIFDCVNQQVGLDFHEEIIQEPPNKDAQEFYDILRAAQRPLWHGCTNHSELSVAVRMMSIKSDYNISRECFNQILGLLKEISPTDNLVPINFYRTKKLMSRLGLMVHHSTYPVHHSTPPIEESRLAEHRQYIEPDGDTFCPSKDAVHRLSNILKSKYDDPYLSWTKIPLDVREMWFREFEKSFYWLPQHHDRIRRNFDKCASARLSDMLHDARSSDERPAWLGESVWLHLCGEWKRPDYVKKREHNKQNRNSDCGGLGSSLHTGGSIPHTEHRRMMKKCIGTRTYPNRATWTHQRQTDKAWVDSKAQKVHDDYVRLEEVHRHSSAGHGSSAASLNRSDYDLWMEAAGGKKKWRIYGLGSQGKAYNAQTSLTLYPPHAQETFEDMMRRQVAAFTEYMTQRMNKNMEEMQRRMKNQFKKKKKKKKNLTIQEEEEEEEEEEESGDEDMGVDDEERREEMASRSTNILSRVNRIRQNLQSSLEAISLEIEDVSYQHAGHAGVKGDANETHFNIKVVSPKFDGQSLVKRHRMVYDLLADELKTGLHAISIVAKTPQESGMVNKS